MLKSSEVLKSVLESKGVSWEPQYGGALARLVEMFDENIAEAMFERAKENAEKVTQKVDDVLTSLEYDNRNAKNITDSLERLVKKAESIIQTATSIGENKISDPQDAKTLILFKSLLNAGKEAFGEERMTDSAIASICESASYITYRTVMGPKNEPTEPYSRGRRV